MYIYVRERRVESGGFVFSEPNFLTPQKKNFELTRALKTNTCIKNTSRRNGVCYNLRGALSTVSHSSQS